VFDKVFNLWLSLFLMDKRGIVGSLIVVGVLLVVGFFWFVGEKNSYEPEDDCVPASCCHSNACAWESEAPDCSETLCTMTCEPNTMDCGAGYCEVVGGECEVVWDAAE
jgi:hypothetical protein